MARRVRHYSDCGNFYDYYRRTGTVPKTLCNREMSGNYFFTGDVEQVTCSRCQKRLEKEGRMPGQANGTVLTVLQPSDVDSGDKHHEAWLSRLGL